MFLLLALKLERGPRMKERKSFSEKRKERKVKKKKASTYASCGGLLGPSKPSATTFPCGPAAFRSSSPIINFYANTQNKIDK
jgi:hypothetical protein